MSILATDSFVRANASTLGANWTKLSGFSDLKISSNHAIGSVSSPDCADAYTGAGTISLDQWAQVVLASSTSSDGGPTLRSDLASTFYLFDTFTGNAFFGFYKCISGSFTQLSSSNFTIANGDTLYTEVQSTTIKTKQNGTVRHNFTDSAIDGSTVGGARPGLHSSGTGNLYGDGSSNGYTMGDFLTPSAFSNWEEMARPESVRNVILPVMSN